MLITITLLYHLNTVIIFILQVKKLDLEIECLAHCVANKWYSQISSYLFDIYLTHSISLLDYILE